MNREVHVQFWEGVGLRCPALLTDGLHDALICSGACGVGANSLESALEFRIGKLHQNRVCASSEPLSIIIPI